MSNDARRSARNVFECAVREMFEAGYDAEMLGEEIGYVVQDWENEFGAQPPARASGGAS